MTKINYSEIWGLREEKYQWLEKHDLASTEWQELKPTKPFYFFIPQKEEGKKEYDQFWKITEIFPINGVGITTARDSFVIDNNRERLINRIRLFKNSNYSDDDLHLFFKIRKKLGWDIRKAWNMLQDIPDSKISNYFQPILYRPFDQKWIFYHDSLVWRTVKRIMKNMLQPNLGLLVKRQQKQAFSYAFVTNQITESCVFESAYANNTVLPLYLYNLKERSEQSSLLNEDQELKSEKTPNISKKLIDELKSAFPKEVGPEETFYYIYAVLYSNTYRQKYQEFLKVDFPRVPMTKDYGLFIELGRLGKKLVDLHLLKSLDLNNLSTQYKVDGDNQVILVEYYQLPLVLTEWTEAEKKGQETQISHEGQSVYINRSQYFAPISPEVWNYHVGGYQVIEKWLKDRKNQKLSLEDIKHFCQMTTAIAKTIEIQKSIDDLYLKLEQTLIQTV